MKRTLDLEEDIGALKLRQEKFDDKRADVYLDTSTDPETGEKRHDYYVNGVKVGKDQGYIGVTTYIHNNLFKKFDKEAAVQNVLRSPKYTTCSTYRYYLKPKEEILAMWEDSGAQGTDLHDKIDAFLRGGNIDELFTDNLFLFRFCLASVLMGAARDCILFGSESALHDPELRLTGCIDALFYNPKTKSFVLLDWKANSVKKDHYGEFGIHPTSSNIRDTKYNRYVCQLNIYALMLKRNYNLPCDKLYVVGFGIDKLMEQPDYKTMDDNQKLDRLLENLDAYEVQSDQQFQDDFIKNRKAEVAEFLKSQK